MSLSASPATPASLPDPTSDPTSDRLPDARSATSFRDSASAASPLTVRQENFCRYYAETGNAAEAARAAGYAEGSARQTGYDLLARPAVAARIGAIRQAAQTVERQETQILLGRLEQVWDAAVAAGSATLMLRVVKMQAEQTGAPAGAAPGRPGQLSLPGGDARSRPADPDAANPDAPTSPPAGPPEYLSEGPSEGPVAEAVRRGRHRTERALATHRANRPILEQRPDFDEAAWLATAQRLHATVEERRRPQQRTEPVAGRTTEGRPAGMSASPSAGPSDSISDGEISPSDDPDMTNPDISLHNSLHMSLRRAGLLLAEPAGDAPFDVQRWREDPFGEARRIQAERREMTLEETLAYRAALAKNRATGRVRYYDPVPGLFPQIPHGGTFLQPAGDPGLGERRAAEEEQFLLRHLARARPPLASETAGCYLLKFVYRRPSLGISDRIAARRAAR